MVGRRNVCQSGKIGYRNSGEAKIGAREFSIKLNRLGVYFETMFSYQCARCNKWHLTRTERFNGVVNNIAMAAAPLDVQRWAMPAALRDDAESRMREPMKPARRCTNRPRGLRRV